MSASVKPSTTSLLCSLLAILYLPEAARAQTQKTAPPQAPARLTLFLDCQTSCFEEYLRTEVTLADYVRDRTGAEVHVLITSAETGAGGREYTLAFIGAGRFAVVDRTLKTVTTSSDPDDVVRRQIATALRLGIINYLSHESVPPALSVNARIGEADARPAGGRDRWNNWVFSLSASASFAGEESSRERQLGGEISVDRITPDWKITFGAEIDHETEEFDLDEEEPVRADRRERDFQWLVVKGLGEHWSIGGTGEVESSTFDNIKLAVSAAPAVEFNVFPYSTYTRRQLRTMYQVGPQQVAYYERTLFGKTEETLVSHQLSVAFEQREPWGSLDARTEFSQYLHDLDKTRLELEGDVSFRLTRGLSVGAEISVSRIRDQLSLPARDATDEEILLRIRRLQSGYEYQVGMNVTYTFGSIFSSVVNPRFGQ